MIYSYPNILCNCLNHGQFYFNSIYDQLISENIYFKLQITYLPSPHVAQLQVQVLYQSRFGSLAYFTRLFAWSRCFQRQKILFAQLLPDYCFNETMTSKAIIINSSPKFQIVKLCCIAVYFPISQKLKSSRLQVLPFQSCNQFNLRNQ